jgi:malonyl-CoA/methylmalonyl-CoA synthetase
MTTHGSLFGRAAAHGHNTAVITDAGAWTFQGLEDASRRVAASLLDGRADLGEAPIAFLADPGLDYVVALFAIWRAGGIAVALAVSHPPAELAHMIRSARASLVLADERHKDVLAAVAQECGVRFHTISDLAAGVPASEPELAPHRRAIMLFTSGTTGRPRGVIHTHASLAAQIASLVEAWEWSASDRILLVLPLHHVHGIVNVLCCSLWSGAMCEMPQRFDAWAAWQRIASAELTLFMAVPTIYHKLIAAWEALPPEQRRAGSVGASGLRLMVSGSAALPVPTLTRWREITGHTLLERYGMTEIGMALSNPLHGERRPGFVGMPLPGVEVRLVDEQGREVPDGTPGEIEVRGPGVFLEYWQDEQATLAAFHNSWFRTGDIAVLEDGMHRILGRSSIDIIKTGGYKVSALEIEDVLRTHPAVAECAVVGVADAEWGERVCAAIELQPDEKLTLPELQEWTRTRVAPYKTPRALRCVSALPRNAMGKVVKPEVRELFT